MNEYLSILRRNFISPLVIAIYSLGIALLLLGEVRDAWFISFVITVNTLFAIVQEIRARRAIKKLELLSAPRARRRLKNGEFEDVLYDQLHVDDMIKIEHGDELPADGEVIESRGLEINEGILTGESTPIEKPVKSTVLAASAVVAGAGMVKVTAVGAYTKAGVMTATLKQYSPTLTPLQKAINRAITLLTYGAMGIGVLIFIVYSIMGESSITTFKTIAAAAVAVVPEGLLLASSVLLAFGSLKLARAKVLPQKLDAIEAMALLNVLCVDKTGTLTSDTITFHSFKLLTDNLSEEKAAQLIAITAHETSGANATGDAISGALKRPKQYEIKDVMAFSSERKMSGVRVVIDGNVRTIIMGAPEYVSKLARLNDKHKEMIQRYVSEGKRVLLAAESSDTSGPIKDMQSKSAMVIGIVVLENELRDGIKKTVSFLQNNNVSLRVISGDNPATVSHIAQKVGIKKFDHVITGAELEEVSADAWDKTVLDTTVFARVLPEQKEKIIETFKRHDAFTGMVGDGVNDALAIKKADLGVAMYAGAAATRRVADIVLLNNSFTSLPLGMRLGNNIMLAIELIAMLFFHKIIYGVILLFITFAVGIVYPFEPRFVTFMNIFFVTLPTLIWTLLPPIPEKPVSPATFWRDTLGLVWPIGVGTGVMVALSYVLLHAISPSHDQVATLTVFIATALGVTSVMLVSKLRAVKMSRSLKVGRVILVVCALLGMIVSLFVPMAREFFSFEVPTLQLATVGFICCAAAIMLQLAVAFCIKRYMRAVV